MASANTVHIGPGHLAAEFALAVLSAVADFANPGPELVFADAELLAPVPHFIVLVEANALAILAPPVGLCCLTLNSPSGRITATLSEVFPSG